MVSPGLTLLNKSVQETLSYFDKYDYPLTGHELWFWQAGSRFSASEISKALSKNTPYYFLKGRELLISRRKQKSLSSQKKYRHVTSVVTVLSRFPFIQAIFITGALAMSNSPESDDIDLMLITRKNTLWLARLMVILYLKLKHLRRDPHLPEHSSVRVSDKVCDNLWLDENHLLQPDHNLYIAHELLQARCVYDRGGVYRKLIKDNIWAKKYLPIAYTETQKHLKNISYSEESYFFSGIINCALYILNLFLFLPQYLYMRHGLTSEKIGLGYAFFHPSPSRV